MIPGAVAQRAPQSSRPDSLLTPSAV